MNPYVCTALAVLLFGANATAQKADTLRRQLQVFTSEEIQLDEQAPLSITHTQPRTYKPQSQAFSPSRLLAEQSPNASFLHTLSPMPALLAGDKHLGYISLAGGIRYNAYLSAGLRPIQNDKQVLDLYLRGRYTNYAITSNRYQQAEHTVHVKEYQYAFGADYLAKLGGGTLLALGFDFADEEHNYNAEFARQLRNVSYRFRAKLGNEEDEDARWTYFVNPYFRHTHLEARSEGSLSMTPNEYQLGVASALNYRLNPTFAFGVFAEGYGLAYGKVRTINYLGKAEQLYSNMGVIKFDPYVSWGRHTRFSAKIGLGVDLFRFLGKTKVEFSPELEVDWKFAPSWQVALKNKSELNSNALSQLFEQMPYLNLGTAVPPTIAPINAELKLEGLVMPNLSMTLFAQHSRYRDAINFISDWREGFTPSVADGHRTSLGAALSYRVASVMTLKAGATSHNWSASISGRPSLTLDAALLYKPSEALELNAAYELQYGINQLLAGYTQSSGQYVEPHLEALPTYSVFRFGGSYRLNPRFSLRAFGHFVSSAKATLYYGHIPQRIAFNVGASYQF